MTTEINSTEKVTEGSEIKGLFSRPESIPITVSSEKYGKIKFVIRPMNNDVYAQMGEVMKSDNLDLNKLKNIDGLKVFSSMYYPAMKVVFPYCCIMPKVIVGDSTEKTTINIANMPMDVCLGLFEQIMQASGVSEAGEESRKNL